MIFRTFCQFGELVEVHCQKPSKSIDLTISPRGKMVVICHVLSGWFHIFERLENAALCPYLQCLLDCRKWCFFLWSMVALLGSSDLCFLCVCLPFRLPCWLRWTMSGRYGQSGISMLWSGSCNDGDPKAKVTKRSKQPIYTHVIKSWAILCEDYLKNVIFRTRPVHTNCQLPLTWILWPHSSDWFAVCLYFIDSRWLMTS